jgi:hypothetical protein
MKPDAGMLNRKAFNPNNNLTKSWQPQDCSKHKQLLMLDLKVTAFLCGLPG